MSYTARAFDLNGKPYHKTFSDTTKAQQWIVQEKEKKAQSHLVNHREIAIQEYFTLYIENAKIRWSCGTTRIYRNYLDHHISPIMGNKKMREVSLFDAINLQASICLENLNNKTNNQVLMFFKQVIGHASIGHGVHRVCDEFPLYGMRLLPETAKEMQFWTEDELSYFFNHQEVRQHHYFDFMLMAINTGMRIGEIGGLQVKKIDFPGNHIIVSNALKLKKNGFEIGSTKTHAIRYLKMNATVRQMLQKIIKNKSNDDLIFLNERGKLINISLFSCAQFKPLQRKIGMKKIIRFHDIRHTFASHYLMRGGDLLSAKQMLGHSFLETTMVYSHMHNDFKQHEADLVTI